MCLLMFYISQNNWEVTFMLPNVLVESVLDFAIRRKWNDAKIKQGCYWVKRAKEKHPGFDLTPKPGPR